MSRTESRDFLKLWTQSLGRYRLKSTGDFHVYHVPYFSTRLTCPAYLARPSVRPKDLKTIEDLCKKRKRGKPYFQYLHTKKRIPQVIKSLKKRSYVVEVQTNINFWYEPWEFQLPKGYTLECGDFFEPRLHKDYLRMCRTIFGDTDGFLRKNDRLVRDLKLDTNILVIYNRARKPVACGAYSIVGEMGWLFAGCVLPKYRKKGLWKALVSARQAFSQSKGANRWVLTTSTDAIRRKADSSIYMTTFVQEDSGNK